MTGFFMQNALASGIGLLAGIMYYALTTDYQISVLLTTTACGFLSVHLPGIQQPTLLSYRLICSASWLASVWIPLMLFFYRPTDFLIAWVCMVFFTHRFWFIVDRISLRRDFTRTIAGIVLLPLMLTAYACLALGQVALMPVFLASNTGYISFLLLEQYAYKRNKHTPLHSR